MAFEMLALILAVAIAAYFHAHVTEKIVAKASHDFHDDSSSVFSGDSSHEVDPEVERELAKGRALVKKYSQLRNAEVQFEREQRRNAHQWHSTA